MCWHALNFMKPECSAKFAVRVILGVAVFCATLITQQAASAGPVVVGLWRFNEGSGTNITDSSGLGNNGYLAGSSGHLPTWTNGQAGFGSALAFTNDGANYTLVAIPGSPTTQIGQTPTNAWSITAWAYESSGGTGNFISTYGRVLVIDDGTAQQIESGASGDDEFYTWARTTGAWQVEWGLNGLEAPLLDQWEHLALTYDGTNLTFYVNGGQGTNGSVASIPVSASLWYVGYQGSVMIGSEVGAGSDRNWNGNLDDVAEFVGALTQEQVQTVMSGDFTSFIGGPPGFVTAPDSQVVAPGTNVTFTVGAYGSPTLHYQWYFNGVSLGTGAESPTLTINDVGAAQVGTYSVTVSNSLGTATAAATLSINPTLVGLWRFDEDSGTNVADSSGLGNNGTLGGDNGNLPTWTTSQPGYGYALAFNNDGVNHTYVSIPASPSLQIGQFSSNAWTLTAWAYESSGGTGNFVSAYGRIAVIDDGFAFQLESGASGDDELYTWSENNPAWQIPWGTSSPIAPLLDQWEHWAVVYDGTNLNVYLNGNEAGGGYAFMPVVSSLGFVGYQGAVLIGSELDQPASANWNGMLDDVAIFAGALTQAQVQTVMAGNFSGFMGGQPAFVSQPQGGVVLPGTTATLSVGANGATPLYYQWYRNGASLGPSGTGAILTIPDVQASQAGTYWAVVSNASGTVTSDPAFLSVGSLVALWRFNEGSGTTAFDASGNGNDGTLVGPTWATGKYGGGLQFVNNGSDYSYVSVPGSPLLEIGQTASNPWSITAWAYESSGGTGNFVATYGRILVIDDGLLFQLESGASGDPQFYTWDNDTFSWQFGWGSNNAVSPLLDQWVHWAVTYDGVGTLTLYRNGDTGTNGGMAVNSVNQYLEYGSLDQGAITIGSELDQPANRTWNGVLDDIAVFDAALTPAQVQAVMAGNFNGFVARPPLSISHSAANTYLSWPVSAQTFQLQSNTSLSSVGWSAVGTRPVLNGSTLTVTLPNSAHPVYYRLVGP